MNIDVAILEMSKRMKIAADFGEVYQEDIKAVLQGCKEKLRIQVIGKKTIYWNIPQNMVERSITGVVKKLVKQSLVYEKFHIQEKIFLFKHPSCDGNQIKYGLGLYADSREKYISDKLHFLVFSDDIK